MLCEGAEAARGARRRRVERVKRVMCMVVWGGGAGGPEADVGVWEGREVVGGRGGEVGMEKL